MLSRKGLRRHTALVSSANVELVRSIYAAWERGDYSGSLGWASSDIEFVFGDEPDPGKWVGLGVMVQHWREQLGPGKTSASRLASTGNSTMSGSSVSITIGSASQSSEARRWTMSRRLIVSVSPSFGCADSALPSC